MRRFQGFFTVFSCFLSANISQQGVQGRKPLSNAKNARRMERGKEITLLAIDDGAISLHPPCT